MTRRLFGVPSQWLYLLPGLTDEGRLEQSLWAAETLVADGDDLTVGQLVALLQGGGGGGGGHLILEVQGNVAQLLLDVTHDLTLSWREEILQFSRWYLFSLSSWSVYTERWN